MSEEHWKLEKDLCRCCLSEGSFKNLAEPCAVPGVGNIEYSEMLLESLDVNITPVAGSLCASTFTICDECILRLQDACIFKRQVLTSEKRFRDLYSRNVFESHSKELAVKKEALDSDNEDAVKMELEPDDDDFRLEYDDGDDNKSDIELDLQAVKKAKTKKPKAKEKPKPKKRAVRPRKPAEAEPGTEAEGEAEPKAKKGSTSGKFRLGDTDYTRDGDSYVCSRCEKRYDKMFSLRSHIKTKHYKIPRFPCPYCEECFMTPAPLTVHKLEVHAVDDRFKCNACKGTFNTKVQLRKHLNNFHMMGERYKCELCEYESFSFEGLDYTMVEDGDECKYSCNKCSTVYKSLSWMSRHIRGEHLSPNKRQFEKVEIEIAMNDELPKNQGQVKENSLVCEVCKKRVKEKNMAGHMRTHGPFKCPECAFQLRSAEELRSHKRKTHSHTCEVCDMKTSCQTRMIGHLRTHGIFKCRDCPEKFTRKLELSAHKKKAHRTKRTKSFFGIGFTVVEDGVECNYICHQCGTIRQSMSSIRYHVKRHVDSSTGSQIRQLKKFICDYCGKETSEKWKMVRHISLWHSLVKCSECSVVCTSSFELSSHTRSHHPDKMLSCGICGFKSFKKLLLIKHQRKVHMGEKNVACPHCDAKFFDSRMLNKHLVRHNPVKKYECRFCKKRFPRKNARHMHEKIHLGHKNKVCAICDARFVQKASLNYHMKKYHPEAI